MRMRLFISAALAVLYGVFRSLYTPYARLIVQAKLSPLQIGGDDIQYGLSRAMTIADFVSAFITLLLVASLVLIWLTYYLSRTSPAPLMITAVPEPTITPNS